MKVELLEAVNPIIRRVLELSEEPGAAKNLEAVQQEIGPMLDNVKAFDLRRPLTRSADGVAPSAEFALICWIDEILTWWKPEWENVILEISRCKTRDRGPHLFWEQAERAVVFAGSTPAARDLLEVFALCVELGFVGVRPDISVRQQWLRHAWKSDWR